MNDTEFRAWLDASRMSQQEAADHLGASRMSVSRWAKGERAIPDEIAAKIAPAEDAPTVDPEPALDAKPTGRIDQHAPGHVANSTPIPHVGDIVRIAPPHGGPWMQVRWIENGLYNCWFEHDGKRYADDYSLEKLETLYADRKAAGVLWPPKGNIEALPISTFHAKPYVPQKAKEGIHRFGVVHPD
jgi:transcriptional regulator with XRE-family HTH domain